MSARDGALVSLAGRKYTTDTEAISWGTVKPTRQGVDQGAGAGENSLSNEVVWRRVRDNWVGGAGQEYADLIDEEDESSPIRFASSSGMDVFERRLISMGAPISSIGGVRSGTFRGSFSENGPFAQIGVADTGDLVIVEFWQTSAVDQTLYSSSRNGEAGIRFSVQWDGGTSMAFLRLEINNTAATTTYAFSRDTADLWNQVEVGERHRVGFYLVESGANLSYEIRQYNLTSGVTDSDNLNTAYTTLASGTFAIATPIHVGGPSYVGEGINPATGASEDGPGISYFHIEAGTGPLLTYTADVTDPAVWLETAGTVDASWVSGDTTGVTPTATFTLDDEIPVQLYSTMATSQAYGSLVNTTFQGVVVAVGFRHAYVYAVTPDDSSATELIMIIPLTQRDVETNERLRLAVFADGVMYWQGTSGTMYQDVITYVDDGIGPPDFYFERTELAQDGAGQELFACDSRLLSSDGNTLWEIAADGTPTEIYGHYAETFRWNGAVAAPNAIYVWGSLAASSQVFQLPVSDSTGALDPPIPALLLPPGEYVHTLVPFLGVVILGTNRGLRVCTVDGDGSLRMGPALTDMGQVTAITPVDSKAYCTGTVSPYLYVVDLARFTEPLVPAYAALTNDIADSTEVFRSGFSRVYDQVVAVLGNALTDEPLVVVASVDHLGGVFSSDGVDSLHVVEGEIDLGWFTYGIGEELSFDSLTVECGPLTLGSSWTVTAYVDTAATVGVLSGVLDFSNGSVLDLFSTGDVRARRFKVRLVATSDQTEGTAPEVTSVTLRASPIPFMSDTMLLPLILTDRVTDERGQEYSLDVFEEWSHLIGLRDTRERVQLSIGGYEATVRVESIEVQSGGLGGGNGLDGYDREEAFMAGTWQVRLVTVESA